MSLLIVPAPAEGSILEFTEGLSFWGGVDADTGIVVDAHHPHYGQALAGKIVMMPTSRGSCSGSGVLLELAMNGRAPAALIFRENEDTLTLGAVIASNMFSCPVAVLRLAAKEYATLATDAHAKIVGQQLLSDSLTIDLKPLSPSLLTLSKEEDQMLSGDSGVAVKVAMETLCTMALVQGAESLVEVTRGHIDGCIYAGNANLVFAEKMAAMEAQVRIPTTMNAISVDHQNWRAQGVEPNFGLAASQLADAYVRMGAMPSFTCAPYQSVESTPVFGENIGWSESNAVIYANTVLGARTPKHPDFLDLFIALTGRAPKSGVYLDENRVPQILIDVELPEGHDDAVWPLLGWLVGRMSPDTIPVIFGLENTLMSADDLRAVCAAFGTTSAAPMFHISGVTPEANIAPVNAAVHKKLSRTDFSDAWRTLNSGPKTIDLVALGSPHFSLEETRKFARLMSGRQCHSGVSVIITLSRETKVAAIEEGLYAVLEKAGVRFYSDLCWCSISEPVFPIEAKTLMTNSGKYAHYAPGLSGRAVRFGSLADCAYAAEFGCVVDELPNIFT